MYFYTSGRDMGKVIDIDTDSDICDKFPILKYLILVNVSFRWM